MILAAIDIGSNAARLLIMKVEKEKKGFSYQKLKLLRYPIRLGFDAFVHNRISEEKTNKLLIMLEAFSLFMNLYDVEDYLAYATSALRESSNGEELLQRIDKETGLTINVIDGLTEASLLYQTHFESQLTADKNYIYVDVGGGSTEITFFSSEGLRESQSFKIGTIRLLKGLVEDKLWQEMLSWVSTRANERGSHRGIGSGGNINTLFQLSSKAKDEPLTISYVRDMRQIMAELSLEERMKTYSLKPDRADVIVHALSIYEAVYSAANAEVIFVPKIGLSDGMIRLLAKKKSELY